MPGGDRTGPAGMGPMTGRAAGYCAGYPVPGYVNPIPGRGFGRGFGRGGGRGRRNWYHETGLTGWQRAGMGFPVYGGTVPYTIPPAYSTTGQQELDVLKKQADYFADSLEGINERIKELEKESAEQSKEGAKK